MTKKFHCERRGDDGWSCDNQCDDCRASAPLQDTPSIPKQEGEGILLPLRELLNCPDLTPKQEPDGPVCSTEFREPSEVVNFLESELCAANARIQSLEKDVNRYKERSSKLATQQLLDISRIAELENEINTLKGK